MQGQFIPRLGLLILFPGYFVYNYGVMSGFWPSFEIKYFGFFICVFSGFGFLYFIKKSYFGFKLSPVLELFFLILILYMLLWSFGAFKLILDAPYSTDALRESIYTVMIWLACYFVAVRYDIDDKKNCNALLISAFAIATLLLHAIIVNGSLLGLFMVFNGSNLDGNIAATYQGAGRSIVVVSLLITGFQRSLRSQIGVMVVTIIILVLLGSRAHLFAMLALFLSFLGIMAFKFSRWGVIVWTLIIALAASYFFFDLFFETRAAEIFDLDASTSWQARLYAFEAAMNIIDTNPIYGAFGYHHESIEGYAHNILSAWTQYGIIGFLMFVTLLIYSMIVSLRQIYTCQTIKKIWMVAFQFTFIAIFLALFSEPIHASVFPALAWGFTVQATCSRFQRHNLK